MGNDWDNDHDEGNGPALLSLVAIATIVIIVITGVVALVVFSRP